MRYTSSRPLISAILHKNDAVRLRGIMAGIITGGMIIDRIMTARNYDRAE